MPLPASTSWTRSSLSPRSRRDPTHLPRQLGGDGSLPLRLPDVGDRLDVHRALGARIEEVEIVSHLIAELVESVRVRRE